MHNYKSTFEDPFKIYFRLSESQSLRDTRVFLYDYDSWSSYLRCDYKKKKKERKRKKKRKISQHRIIVEIISMLNFSDNNKISINHYRFNNNPILLFINDQTNVRRLITQLRI